MDLVFVESDFGIISMSQNGTLRDKDISWVKRSFTSLKEYEKHMWTSKSGKFYKFNKTYIGKVD